MSYILQYTLDMMIVMIIATPFVVYIRYKSRKKRDIGLVNRWHEVGIMTFWVYLIGLFYETIVPKNGVSLQYAEMRIQNQDGLGINFHLFRVFTDVYNAIHYLNLWQPFFINFLGNIAIFMPIGFLLPLLWRKMEKFFFVFFTGLGLSLFIETMQLPQYRSTDVDDLWLNTLGAILGFCIYKQFAKRIPKLKEKFKVFV
ncbi:VanZ family protein [Rummeliibacillus sp. NPDC094406]|uniref:VanZ family protein n=1 Tax=Rummeliibacillus sp. NPDC094406 TaxID=3364511 RepID=UPI00381CE3B7